jgi:hypothetical protein
LYFCNQSKMNQKQNMKKQLLTVAMCLIALGIHAQSIDFDLVNKTGITETNYSTWAVATGASAEATFGGVSISVANGAHSTADVIQSNWWKDGVNKYSKLIGDGITPKVLLTDGNRVEPTGRVELQFTVSGLSAGTHTLLAYHNNVDGWTAGQLPPISVMVDGKIVSTNVPQTQRAQKPSLSSYTYITFTAVAGTPVVVTYYTEPLAGVTYDTKTNTTSFYVNALVFDEEPPSTIAKDPVPDNYDYHANADGGSIALAWTKSESATSHQVYFGEDSLVVENGTTPAASVSDTTYTASGLSPLKQYYWRVDEVASDGTVSKGKVWTFRPRRLAFPGAEGYGKYAIGGRGGSVYHVTSLADDSVPGTFRYGVSCVKGPRTIVFDVAGVITLTSRLTCSDKYVTIAGQTAPGNGIMFRSCPFGMASDGITRFVRLRLGGGDTYDGMGMAGNDYSIMDHCSVGWTIDEAFSSRNCKNITLQHTLISEALNIAGHKNYSAGTAHGYAATIGGNYGSYHHNLLAHCEGRNWSMSGALDGSGAYAGHHDMFNNVCYNWGGRACDGGTHEGNFVNNYYKMGPSTSQTILLKAELEGTGSGSQSYYVKGNIRENLDGSKTQDALDDTYKYIASNGQVVNWTVFVDKPFFESQANIEPVLAAYKNVLCDVGCNQPVLDNHDTRMVKETLTGTTSTVGSVSGKKGLIDNQNDSGCEGFDGLNIIEASREAGYDTDLDGIPDWYETAKGWDTTVANNNADTDNDSYTDLEEYLNWMALPHFIIKAGTTTSISLPTYFAGYTKNQYYTISENDVLHLSNDGNNNMVLNPSVTANGFYTVKVTASDDDNTTLTRTFNILVSDQATAVKNVISETDATDAPVYSVLGQRIEKKSYQGIAIQKGKKYMSK